jgi:asparagine N-glycosylation enzyme membrane subunit Stt3
MSKTVVLVVELFVLSALILITRCANYEDVLVDGKIYFLDADCYARMSRARLVAEHPGTIVRRHDFENFPDGTTPHTTAPLDYLIVALAAALRPLTTQPLDLAGAIISPLLALAGGWFLWWSLGRFSAPGRYAALLVYTFSAILVHGTALGRPDHQSLLIVLLLVAFVAEWILAEKPSVGWSVASGLSWGMALWVSLYEPLILLGGLALFSLFSRRSNWTCTIAPARVVCFSRRCAAGCRDRAALAGMAGVAAIFRELGGDDRRAQTCRPNEPNLVRLGWRLASF